MADLVGHLWLNRWGICHFNGQGIYHLMGGALWFNGWVTYGLMGGAVMYTILLYSAVVTIPHIFWVSQSPNLFWYGHTFVVPFPTSSALRYHPPSLLGSALAKYFNFACFIPLLCLQSCMGRVSYLLPPNIWVDGPSLLTVWKVGSEDSSLNKEQLHRPALRAHDHIYFVVIAMRSMIGSCDASIRHRSFPTFVLEVRLSYPSL